MEEKKSILHELYVFSEWKPEPEYIQKPDNILSENIPALWRWLKLFGPKKSLVDSITVYKEYQQKWHMALGDEGKVIAVLTDNILEIRTKRSEYATIAARTTVSRDGYSQWRKLVWSPDCSFLVLAYGNGIVSFYDLTASNLFNIPADCSRPGGLECTDNTHAVADIIFMPLRVKDNKWNWEVMVITYDGKLRGYLVSQTEGFTLHHKFSFPGGVGALAFCPAHATLYVAGLPRGSSKDPSSPLNAGITAWRIVNDEPFYKLSVVSDELEAQLANERFQMYIPFVSAKNLAFITKMSLSPDGCKLVCLHCNGDVSIWRLPLIKLLYQHPLVGQPDHDLRNPFVKQENANKNVMLYHAADVSWWSNEEIIMSRFSGAVTVCNVEDMVNILGKKPEFFQGAPQITCARDGSFMVLECESTVLPAKKSRSDESMEVVVRPDLEADDSMYDLTKELIKSVLYTITDMETFQPRPKKITVMSRIYRLLGVKSTTPNELFSRKIESGNYSEALILAETFNLDSDLVYQQQWRKNPVSTDAITKYLSKVSKKIWVVHQCVDRLPESLPAAKELLQFGLDLTNDEILKEINKERTVNIISDPEDITLEDLNAYTSELLRCRHVMLFYKDRLKLYESVLKGEKSTYKKNLYDSLRSNSVVHSAIELAKDRRFDALICLWPYIQSVNMRIQVLSAIPETTCPFDYKSLLPIRAPLEFFEELPLPDPPPPGSDWCRKDIFRSIWSSNWSEDTTPETETVSNDDEQKIISSWYNKRAREIEERSGIISHAVTLLTLGKVGGGVEGLDNILFHILTLDVLLYDLNIEGVTLAQMEKMTNLDVCKLLTSTSTPETFVSDLKEFVIPYLKRYEQLTNRTEFCLVGITDLLESMSVDDLSSILLVLQSPTQFKLDVRNHLELAERCLFAYGGTDQLDKACDLLDTILKETDGSISSSSLVKRVTSLERLVTGSTRIAWRGVLVPPRDLRELHTDTRQSLALLTRVARSLARGEQKPTPQDWDKLLKDLLELQTTLFNCVTKEQIYEIYASSLLTSGDAASVKLAGDVLACEANMRRSSLVSYEKTVELVTNAAREYFNSASSLTDPALHLARCCLTLVKDKTSLIEQELDLISALKILNSFHLTVLPIQVRLCDDKMTLIEECLKLDANAFLASHKLLKLAKLLRIAGSDEQTREGKVLQRVGEYAVVAGDIGGASAVSAARRLAALRYAPAAALLAHVATHAHAHADRDARRDLYAAAVTHAPASSIEDILRARLALELEGLQQMGSALKEHGRLNERWPSTDDEFADAITTPVIEKKDLVEPPETNKKMPLFNYLLDSFHSKFNLSENKTSSFEPKNRSVHCQEFYRTLYPEHGVSESHYRYERFSAPDGVGAPVAHAALSWYYVHNCLHDGDSCHMETEVVQKCAEEMLYKDTPLAVSCLLRSTQDSRLTEKLIESHNTDTVVSAALYATLVKCNAPDLRDNVYLTRPKKMARMTLKQRNASQEQIEIIRQCIDKLTGMGEVDKLREFGFTVNGLLFNADKDYRREIIHRVARSPQKEHLQAACSLADKYGLDALEAWLAHAEADPALAHLTLATLPRADAHAYTRIKDVIWPQICGNNHTALINYFTLLKSIDDKPLVFGLTADAHIRLLKKAKAASHDLDYKLIIGQPSSEEFSAHMLEIIKPETVALLTKFLRGLPQLHIKIPLAVNTIYTMWLTKYFFSVSPSQESNKKWMQQYRQCASYFNKLAKNGLLQFVINTCFSDEAIQRVPWGTRSLMIMQASDYCLHEQDNFKFDKSERTWSQMGQELSQWARFLENFHSTTAQGIIDSSCVPRGDIWTDIEKSHGNIDKMVSSVSRLVVAANAQPAALSALLQCLQVDLPIQRVFEYITEHDVRSLQEMQILETRLTQYHKEGIKFSEELLSRVMRKATKYGLPPHKQISLLSLSPRAQVQDSDDLVKIAQFSIDLFRNEWPDCDYAKELTDDKLLSEEGRREAFNEFAQLSDSWQRKKALLDVLNCWPPTRNSDGMSLHCEYLHSLANNSVDQKESLVLIRLLLRRPALTEQEVGWLVENVKSEAVVNVVWIVLLSELDRCKRDIPRLVMRHKEAIQNQEIEDDFIKELLDNDLFIKLVPTPLYSSIVNYVINRESSSGEPSSGVYTVSWAAGELMKANYLAEAGHLRLMAIGVPTSLRGFTQSILYCKNMLSNK